MARQVEEARTAVAAAEERTQEAARLAAEAEAARVAATVSVAELERRVAAGEATQDDLDRARRRAAEVATGATQARERADRVRAWTEDFSVRVATANDRLAKAEQAWRDAEGAGLSIEGPKDASPWGMISWAISTRRFYSPPPSSHVRSLASASPPALVTDARLRPLPKVATVLGGIGRNPRSHRSA